MKLKLEGWKKNRERILELRNGGGKVWNWMG